MEITSENFDDELPNILTAIRNASFLCFDCEFSGLGRGGSAASAYETPEILYSKWKANVGNFMILQFGLCIFRYDADKNLFEYTCYSCYVFPKLPPVLRGLRNSVNQLTCSVQTDCLDFLASQNFDFNKWVCKGVGYLRDKEIESLAEEIKEKHAWRQINKATADGQNPLTVPDTMKPKINSILKQVQSFIENTEKSKENNPLKLSGLNAFERRIVYQTLEQKYGLQLYMESNRVDNNRVDMTIQKCLTKEENEEFRKKKLEKNLEELKDANGFCRVISEITSSGKPLVGHNISLDLLHTFKAFCTDLPDTWRGFKTAIRDWFPIVIDTKVLACQPPIKSLVGTNSSLADLLNRVGKNPFGGSIPVEAVSEERGYSKEQLTDAELLHDAGFDAYATGLVFIALSSYFGIFEGEGDCFKVNEYARRTTNDIPWDLIRPFSNKLCAGKPVDLPYLNLSGEDMVVDRSHVFYLEVRDGRKWTNKDILELFSPFGQVHIHWIQKNSAFVSLAKRGQAALAVKGLVECRPKDAKWTIVMAQEYLDKQERLILGENYVSGSSSGSSLLGKRSISQDQQEKMDTSSSSGEDVGGEAKVTRKSVENGDSM